jgi:hypothetical protein
MRTSSGPLGAGLAEPLLDQNMDFTAIVGQQDRAATKVCVLMMETTIFLSSNRGETLDTDWRDLC